MSCLSGRFAVKLVALLAAASRGAAAQDTTPLAPGTHIRLKLAPAGTEWVCGERRVR